MRILFLHSNFPAQFRHVATEIAKDKRHQVVFGTNRREGSLPGVYKALYAPKREAHPETHHYVQTLENAVLQGQAVYRMADDLKARGFVPDVIYGHSGWGPTLFCKDIFPKAKLLCYFEWFYHARGTDADFDPSDPLSVDAEARIRMKNSPILTDLYSCDRGLSPTLWQRHQFPPEYHSKISVMHDGVDTNFFSPKPGAKLVLPSIDLDLSHVDELVTYVGRGMEPYRGFPQFMESVALLQERRPHCHVVVVGSDRVAYGKTLPDGKTYKELMLEKLPLDLSRLHFTGSLPYDEYRQVLQASSVHIYLTRPFVLSWSMIEAMATGCLIVGSSTASVTEVIQDGHNGLLADFFSPQEIADRVEEALDHPDRMAALRTQARETVLARYDLAKLLPQHVQWVQDGLEGPLLFTVAPEAMGMGGAMERGSDPLSTDLGVSQTEQPALQLDPNSNESLSDPAPDNGASPSLQVGNHTVTADELLPLLSKHQMLPKLWQESFINEAIAPFDCTPAEQEQCQQEFYAEQRLTTEEARQDWLHQQGLTEAQLLTLVTRKLKIEKFKLATWGSKLESYFLKRKRTLDQVVYNLIRVLDRHTAMELYFRLKDDKQPFADLARQYSQGSEAQTGGSIGPVPLSAPHPKLAHFLTISQPGQISSPTRLDDWWLIVQLEKRIPAKFDAAMQQQLLDELFVTWLQEKSKKSDLPKAQKHNPKKPSQKRGFVPAAKS
jgi:glycosyltransferase involved in cell wall biosynthesis/parvulin-like peptidyl-prolyl isomerase